MKTRTTLVLAGALLLALAGCSAGTPAPAETDAPTATETAESVAQLTDDELASIFNDIQFPPGHYGDTNELLDSVYPGLAAADLSCLSPFGVGWETLTDAPLEFGTSNDRSMTAVVSSTGDVAAASALVADATDAIERCASESGLFTMQGMAVTTTVEQTEPSITGTDEVLGWCVTGDVGGNAFTLVGITARVGGNVVALVGWDPATNESYVPQATQMFVDKL